MDDAFLLIGTDFTMLVFTGLILIAKINKLSGPSRLKSLATPLIFCTTVNLGVKPLNELLDMIVGRWEYILSCSHQRY